MAIFDPESGNLILQIVYDGAPYSGKTASIRALGQQLGREVSTPAEQDGRTLMFDWLEYEGGRCLDRPIRCRVISVPGQPELSRRRERILEGADAVIFVADSTAEGIAAAQASLTSLRDYLARRKRKIPLLLQLNKRDSDQALPIDEAIESFDMTHFRRHLSTVATASDGIRETFVMAVGEAIQELRNSDGLRRRLDGEFDTQELVLPSRDELELLLTELYPQTDVER